MYQDNIYPACRTTNYYIVEPSNTASSIAERFGIYEEELLSYNGGILPGDLYPGMVLCIPTAAPPVTLEFCGGSLFAFDFGGEIYRFDAAGTLPFGEYTIINKRIAGGVRSELWLGLSGTDKGIFTRGFPNADGISLGGGDMLILFNLAPVGTHLISGEKPCRAAQGL